MKNLKDYIGKDYNIICANKEEWDAIVDLAIQLNYLVDGENNTYIKGGYSSDKYLGLNYKRNLTVGHLPSFRNRTEIKASEFLPTLTLLEQTKAKYPIGSQFIDLVNNFTFTVATHNFKNFGDKSQICIPVEENRLGTRIARIYKEGKWAEIVEPTDKWIGKTVRITQDTDDKGEVGKVLGFDKKQQYYKGKPYYQIEALYNIYTEDQFEEVIETLVDKSKAVVHCKTQEEWDFVTEKLGYKWQTKTWANDKENSCINIKGRYSDKITYYTKENYYIYSFEEWCKEFGHSMKVEYIEVVTKSEYPEPNKLYKEVIGKIFKVVKEFELDYFVEYEGRHDPIAKNRVKPSTMEAYDRQESAKNIAIGPNSTTTSMTPSAKPLWLIEEERVKENKTMHELVGLKPKFNKGDKVLIVKDFIHPNKKSEIDNTIGIFERYTNSVEDTNIIEYPYGVLVNSRYTCVHKIEHYKEKKSLDLSKPFCILLTKENQVRVQNILGGGYFRNRDNYKFTDINYYYGVNNAGYIDETQVPSRIKSFKDNIVTIEELEEAYSRLGTQPAIRRDTYKVVDNLNMYSSRISGINVDRVSAFGSALQAGRGLGKTELMNEFLKEVNKECKPKEFRLTKPTKTFKSTEITFPTQINIKLKTKNKL